LPAVAERPFGVLLLRHELAGLPQGRLLACTAQLRQSAATIRLLSVVSRIGVPRYRTDLPGGPGAGYRIGDRTAIMTATRRCGVHLAQAGALRLASACDRGPPGHLRPAALPEQPVTKSRSQPISTAQSTTTRTRRRA